MNLIDKLTDDINKNVVPQTHHGEQCPSCMRTVVRRYLKEAETSWRPSEAAVGRAAEIISARCSGSWMTYDSPRWVAEAVLTAAFKVVEVDDDE